MTWIKYFEIGSKSILPNTKIILGVLKFTCKNSSFKTKKNLADKVIISRLTYGISIRGIAPTKSQLDRVQRAQNLAIRC